MAYIYGPMLAIDHDGVVLRSGSGQVYAPDDTDFSTPLPITDLVGLGLTAIEIDGLGITQAFISDLPEVMWRSGVYVLPLSSAKGMREAAEASAASAAASATAARDAVDAAVLLPALNKEPGTFLGVGPSGLEAWLAPPGGTPGIDGAPASWPDTFPPSVHGHSVGQLSDAQDIGRAFLRAVTPEAARATMGAGTGNGNSNLALGPSAAQAAAGNHGHAAESIVFIPSGGLISQTVQTAIVEVNSKVGTGGTGTVPAGTLVVRRYTSGAYPVRGTLPTGAIVLWAGPVQPSIGGSYAVAGVDQYVATAA